MNKSFKQRLAALEALEVQAERDRSPLTDADRKALWMAISVYAVVLDTGGLLERTREYGDTVVLDRALARCNAALLAMRPRLTTLEAIDLWIRELDDPDTFDEDELLGWVWYGLAHKPPVADYSAEGNQISFTSGELRVILSFAGGLQGWWGKVIERAVPLLKEREITIFPLYLEDVRAAIAAIDAGELLCQAPWTPDWPSHRATITVAKGSTCHGLRERLVSALEQYMHQVGCPPIQSTDELRADLVAVLGEMEHAPIQETA